MQQHDVARSIANEVRASRSRSKRDLKSGHQALEDALGQRYWRTATVLEVVGYAAVAHCMLSPTARRMPSKAGHVALAFCAGVGVGHFTRVGELGEAKRFELAEAWDQLTSAGPAGTAIVPSPQRAISSR
jgi:hypothetical protein